MDTKFSVAVHILILISEAAEPMNSEQMAKSVGTNPSYIRKLLALLKGAGLIERLPGYSGYRLQVPKEELTLLQVFRAVSGEESPHLLDMHQNPSDKCIVGRQIRPVLSEMFGEVERAFAAALKAKTLASCIGAMDWESSD